MAKKVVVAPVAKKSFWSYGLIIGILVTVNFALYFFFSNDACLVINILFLVGVAVWVGIDLLWRANSLEKVKEFMIVGLSGIAGFIAIVFIVVAFSSSNVTQQTNTDNSNVDVETGIVIEDGTETEDNSKYDVPVGESSKSSDSSGRPYIISAIFGFIALALLILVLVDPMTSKREQKIADAKQIIADKETLDHNRKVELANTRKPPKAPRT